MGALLPARGCDCRCRKPCLETQGREAFIRPLNREDARWGEMRRWMGFAVKFTTQLRCEFGRGTLCQVSTESSYSGSRMIISSERFASIPAIVQEPHLWPMEIYTPRLFP